MFNIKAHPRKSYESKINIYLKSCLLFSIIFILTFGCYCYTIINGQKCQFILIHSIQTGFNQRKFRLGVVFDDECYTEVLHKNDIPCHFLKRKGFLRRTLSETDVTKGPTSTISNQVGAHCAKIRRKVLFREAVAQFEPNSMFVIALSIFCLSNVSSGGHSGKPHISYKKVTFLHICILL